MDTRDTEARMKGRIEQALDQIHRACQDLTRPANIMEVCGTHTVAIFRHGLRQMLPEGLRLISGPGCPVCVTDQGYIDAAVDIASRPGCIIATYGDMVRVPGSRGTLEACRSAGGVQVVTSADDVMSLARSNPDRQVVFLAVGFETTIPATAVLVQEAEAAGIENLCILCGHKLVIPAMRALLESANTMIDGFLCPGHVSVIIGSDAFLPIAGRYRRPCVVAGFEPVQILHGLARICQQLAQGRAEVDCVYTAAVRPEGNRRALELIRTCFEVVPAKWRGIGIIEDSGLQLRPRYDRFDAARMLNLSMEAVEARPDCRCGQVLCGLISPPECPLFGGACNPDRPVGPCMVSSEGTCAAHYKYGPGGN